jgi:hypothetical protein
MPAMRKVDLDEARAGLVLPGESSWYAGAQ